MIPEIRIGTPISHGSLTVFPLFCEDHSSIDYLLSDEAMEAGSVTVGEVTDQGSVPELVVENKGDRPALFVEGEQLVGAKQNRILNTTLLVAAHAKLKIPVSCVEAGRWKRSSAFFSSSKTGSPYRLRHGLKSSVSRSLKEKLGHRSDQNKVWDDVQKQQSALGVASDTKAMSDTYDKYEEHLAQAQQEMKYVSGACGLAVAIGSQVVTADLFDKPATCQKLWDKLLSGMVLDALMEGEAQSPPDSSQVEQLVKEARNAAWMQTEAVGEGQEYRAEFNGKVGSALVLEGSLVHGSLVAAV